MTTLPSGHTATITRLTSGRSNKGNKIEPDWGSYHEKGDIITLCFTDSGEISKRRTKNVYKVKCTNVSKVIGGYDNRMRKSRNYKEFTYEVI